jgi:hypothetical protein
MVWKRLFRKGRKQSSFLLQYSWFQLGGTSDQVQTISTTIRSRSHNELVDTTIYIDYLVQEIQYGSLWTVPLCAD